MLEDDDLRTSALEKSRRLIERDEEIRRLAPDPSARARILSEGTSSLRIVTLACELYSERPCLGERATVVEDGAVRPLPAIRTLTYADLWARVLACASGLRRAGLVAEGAFVGVCGFASIDWVVADLACLYLAAVSVPLPTAATAVELRPIAREARLACIVCSLEQLGLVTETLAGAPSVASVVVMDLREGDRAGAEAFALGKERLEKGCVKVWTLAEVERLGREKGAVPPVENVAGDALRTIVYTSGSTGSPKGAMFPEQLWTEVLRAPWPGELPGIPYLGVDYMPLNHMAGRGTLMRSLVTGGLTTFVLRADMSTLFEDIRLARPTSLFLVPRAASMIYQHYLSEVAKRRGAADAADEVMRSMRGTFLGDRLLVVQTGSAPTAPEVKEFLARCFEVPVIDGYGSTEGNMITIDGRIAAENVIAYKLVDVPELSYRGSDRPYPRGELAVKVRRAVPGYYKNPAATADLFDEEGYMRTGDIVEQRGPGEVAWIDRKKNVVKLSQGEFVSVSRLEELYGNGSPHVRQVYVYGNSLRAYVLAVVVPTGTADKATLAGELRRIAAREGLRGYEVPRDFLVEPQPFTRENGLLTESNKPSRPRLKARYGERLEQLYETIERSQIQDLYAPDTEGAPARPSADKVRKALAVTLGVSDLDEGMLDQSFLALGGDSLGGVRLADLIKDLAGVAMPVGQILDPTATVRGLMRAVEARLSGEGAPRATFAAVHGAGAGTVKAEDLRLERFVSADELVTALPAEGPARVVLLTGANGFLGRFLLMELLERVPAGGKVVALVRAPDDARAKQRLAEAYAGADPTLPARFAALSGGGRLEVLAADLIAPRLGLSADRWDRLAAEVDVVVHNGALVNHAFSYPQLFEPNVLGTVELIRLALRRRVARLAYVSTVGVAEGLVRSEPVREDEDAASLSARRPINTGIAVGYATSKWASEILLGDLAARAGVPVSIFRCSAILPPRAFVGQVNDADFLTRLLHDVVVTGLAPRTFYAASTTPRLDGLPVDFVARGIATLSLAPSAGREIFHVVAGRRSDGVSFDSLVDWVARAGYPVRRIDDHAAWLRAFRERLAAMPPVEQQRSTLNLLKQWERPIRGALAFDNRRFRERLAATLGAEPEIPRVDALFVEQYLKNMIYAGLIGHPDLTAAA
jgi:fatty acid CoA ligase FadD9